MLRLFQIQHAAQPAFVLGDGLYLLIPVAMFLVDADDTAEASRNVVQ